MGTASVTIRAEESTKRAVRAIAEAHGGSATVSGHDHQITFTVRL